MRPSLSCDVISAQLRRHVQPRCGSASSSCAAWTTTSDNARNRMPEQLDLTVRDALALGDDQRRPRDGPRGPRRLADPRQAGRRDRDRRPPAEHDPDGRPGRRARRAGERVQRRSTSSSPAASSSATASWSASTSTAPDGLAEEASERVISAVTADGGPVPARLRTRASTTRSTRWRRRTSRGRTRSSRAPCSWRQALADLGRISRRARATYSVGIAHSLLLTSPATSARGPRGRACGSASRTCPA